MMTSKFPLLKYTLKFPNHLEILEYDQYWTKAQLTTTDSKLVEFMNYGEDFGFLVEAQRYTGFIDCPQTDLGTCRKIMFGRVSAFAGDDKALDIYFPIFKIDDEYSSENESSIRMWAFFCRGMPELHRMINCELAEFERDPQNARRMVIRGDGGWSSDFLKDGHSRLNRFIEWDPDAEPTRYGEPTNWYFRKIGSEDDFAMN